MRKLNNILDQVAEQRMGIDKAKRKIKKLFRKKPYSSKQLKLNLEEAINAYVADFCLKHDVEFEGWIGNVSGEKGLFNDYYFDFSDIRLDIDTKQSENTIFEWYDDATQ